MYVIFEMMLGFQVNEDKKRMFNPSPKALKDDDQPPIGNTTIKQTKQTNRKVLSGKKKHCLLCVSMSLDNKDTKTHSKQDKNTPAPIRNLMVLIKRLVCSSSFVISKYSL